MAGSPAWGRSVALVAVGDEILAGEVQDANLTYLLRQMRALGVFVSQAAILRDDVSQIAAELPRLADAADEVVVSGGVGPTHDDVTMAGVARAFGVPIERNEMFAGEIRALFGARTNDALLSMANVPAGAVLHGFGGGLLPIVQVRNVFVFPGEPVYLRRKFDLFQEHFRQPPVHRVVLFSRFQEDAIAGPLSLVAGRFPGVRIGSYPQYGEAELQVRISVASRDRTLLDDARRGILSALPPGTIVRMTSGSEGADVGAEPRGA